LPSISHKSTAGPRNENKNCWGNEKEGELTFLVRKPKKLIKNKCINGGRIIGQKIGG
jgi:hypothetical protein